MEAGVSTISATIGAGCDGWRIDRALAASVAELSRERLKALMAEGRVRGVAGIVADPSARASAGAVYRIEIPPASPLDARPQDIALTIVHEDDDLLVVDKPAGLVVHPAAGNLDGTLVNALLHHCRGRLSGIGGMARPGIVHRIDKDTSGLLVVAKSDRAHEGLSKQFAEHSVERRYLAVVAGLPNAEGTVDAALARSPHDRKKIAVQARGKRAVTHYRVVHALRRAALIECRLETGRTHQVRVHMASIGHPLLGDPVYGRARPEHRELLSRLGFHRQALHAAHLGFVHPVSGDHRSFDSAIPADMQALFTALKV